MVLIFFFLFIKGYKLIYGPTLHLWRESWTKRIMHQKLFFFNFCSTFFTWAITWEARVATCEARTRHQRCRTRVRRGDAWGMPQPARPAASRSIMPRGFHFLKADSRRLAPTQLRIGPIRAESGRFRRELAWISLNRPYQPESAETAETADSGRNSKKKKKGAKRTVWTKS